MKGPLTFNSLLSYCKSDTRGASILETYPQRRMKKMDRVFTQVNGNIDKVFEDLIFEISRDSRKVKTFMLSANHNLGIKQGVSVESFCDKRNDDYRDRFMRYFSYSSMI